MDLSKLSTGDKIIAGCGLALLILAFFPWFGKDFGSGNFSASANEGGFGNIFSALGILLGIAMAVVVILKATGKTLPDLPIPWTQAMLIAGGAAAVLILLQLLLGGSASAGGFSVDLDRKIGVFLGLLAGIGLAAGAFLNYQEGDSDTPSASPPQSF